MEDIGLLPMDGKIIVRPEADEQVRASGIVIPQLADRQRKRTGHVLVLDEENQYNLKVGQRIIFDMYGPHEIKHNGVDLLIIDTYNTNVLAVLNSDAEVNVSPEE